MKTVTTCEMTCCKCATVFAMDETLLEFRKKDGEPFFCPSGHAMHYKETPGSMLEKCREELAAAQDELREAQAEITRLKCSFVQKTPAEPPTARRGFFKRLFNG